MNKEEYYYSLAQPKIVYRHLLEYGSITDTQCNLLYNIKQAPSTIRTLKKKLQLEGSSFYIDTEQQNGCDRYGNNTRWLKYILKERQCVNQQ